MKQIFLLAAFCFLACSAYTPSRRYQTNQYSRPSTQYGTPSTQYSNPINQNAGASPQQIPILRSQSTNNGDGAYDYSYETANGIVVQERGYASADGTKAQGAFGYTSPNGQPIQVQYSADEYGFIPQGSHLPVALTGPILKSISQNLEEERRGVVDDGQYRSGQSQVYGQQQYGTAQKYTAPQKYNVAQNYATQQQYSAPTRYNTPQKNSGQQYRAPQSSSSTYGGSAFPKRPQNVYKF